MISQLEGNISPYCLLVIARAYRDACYCPCLYYSPPSPDRFLLWAAFCLGFFGFLQASEFTCPSQLAVSSAMLSVRCFSRLTSHMMIRVKCLITDPFGTGFILHVGCTRHELCPVEAMLSYHAQIPPDPGFLFLFHDCTHLSQNRLCQELRLVLQDAGVDASGYSGHSFGTATAAEQVGLSDSLIQMLGRWKLATFQDYIRRDQETLTSISTRLANSSS